MEIIKEERRRE